MDEPVRTRIPGTRTSIDQDLADQWAVVAQTYVGYWHGHPVHGRQLNSHVIVDDDVEWVEPLDETDDCLFCQRMTDDDIARRILGFQHAMDMEVHRVNVDKFAAWRRDGHEEAEKSYRLNYADYRERVAQVERESAGSMTWYSYDFTTLPYYLQRRLCVQWNHILRDWLAQHPECDYDFGEHAIVTNVLGRTVPLADAEELQALAEDIADDIAFAATPTHPPIQDDWGYGDTF